MEKFVHQSVNISDDITAKNIAKVFFSYSEIFLKGPIWSFWMICHFNNTFFMSDLTFDFF